MISLHLLLAISNTTQVPTLSLSFQLCFTSGKCFQSAFFVIFRHDTSDASHSLCPAIACRIFLGLMIHTPNLRIMRSWGQAQKRPKQRSKKGSPPDSQNGSSANPV